MNRKAIQTHPLLTRKAAKMSRLTGILLFIVGKIDPLEGSVLIVVGSLLMTFWAFLVRSPRLDMHKWATALMIIGVLALFILSYLGGIKTDDPWKVIKWIIIAPYPAGWLLTVVGSFYSWWKYRSK